MPPRQAPGPRMFEAMRARGAARGWWVPSVGSCISRRIVTSPDRFPYVSAANSLAAATGCVAQAIKAGIPGAVLGVVTASGDRSVQAFGLAQREPVSAQTHHGTWFDLASLTKVLFTTPMVMRFVAERRIALDDTLTAAIPD